MAAAAARGTALVTGASSGIGREIAKLLAADHYDLVLVARDAKRLEELGSELAGSRGVRARVVPQDLARPEGVRDLLAEIGRSGISIDILVNNAGLGVAGPFAQTDAKRDLEILQVNVTAVTELAKGVLPGMLRRRAGRILNVASTAAFQPGPLMAVYYASKAYVLSFSEAIANELAGTGVTVTALCPGPTATEFQRKAGLESSRLFAGPLVMDAASVARAGYSGMMRGKRLVIPGFANKAMVQALRVSPRRLVIAIARRLQESRAGQS
ncbi:MAG: SDR family oxidoreductase [Acidobacteriota bacterium]|nr:SDR family oxidoreductase [Acidobacteriota bacterium]